jgi:hypothetical protein
MFPLFLQALGHAGTAVEVGVAEGHYAATFLSMWPGKYVMVDRWSHVAGYEDVMNGPDAEHEDRFRQAMEVAARHAGRVHVMRADSLVAAGQFDDRSLDFVYIDGDHSYAGCKADILAWAPKIKVGGVLAGHDYYNRPPFEVRRAVAEVCGGPCGITHEPSPSWWLMIG